MLWLSQGSMGEGSTPRLLRFLKVHWHEGSSSSLVVGWRPPSVLATRASPASVEKHTRAREREGQQDKSHSLLRPNCRGDIPSLLPYSVHWKQITSCSPHSRRTYAECDPRGAHHWQLWSCLRQAGRQSQKRRVGKRRPWREHSPNQVAGTVKCSRNIIR